MSRPPAARRQRRLGDLIRAEISMMLLRTLKDERIAPLTSVTEVKVSRDLKYATVFISVLGEASARDSTMVALKHAAGRIQHELAKTLQLRHTPVLRFKLDDRIQEGDRVLATMNALHTASRPSEAAEAPADAEDEDATDPDHADD